MIHSNFNIQKKIVKKQIKYIFKGYFHSPSLDYFEDSLKCILDQNRYSEIIFDMKEMNSISAHCLEIFHEKLSQIFNTKKIMIICRNNTKVENLFLHLGFSKWFQFMNAEEQNNRDKTELEESISFKSINATEPNIQVA